MTSALCVALPNSDSRDSLRPLCKDFHPSSDIIVSVVTRPVGLVSRFWSFLHHWLFSIMWTGLSFNQWTIVVWLQVENCTVAMSAVVRGGLAAVCKTSLFYCHQLLSDVHQLSPPRPTHQHTSTSIQPLRSLISSGCSAVLLTFLFPASTQPGHPSMGRCNEYQQKVGRKQVCHTMH